jgi:hypothetical protein
MRQMGIKFERTFKLTPQGVKTAINSNVGISLYDKPPGAGSRRRAPEYRLRAHEKECARGYYLFHTHSRPVAGKNTSTWRVAYGNRTLTRIKPEYMDFDESLPGVDLVHDGKTYSVPIGGTAVVSESFTIKSMYGYRVNAIGAKKGKADGSECNVTLRKKDFLPRSLFCGQRRHYLPG